MSAAYRALIWEQNRVAAAASGMCLATGLLVQVVFWAGSALQLHSVDASVRMSLAIYFCAAVGAAFALVLRQDREGHLVTAFESHLRRLPLPTLALVSVPLLTRAFYVGLLSAVYAAAHLAYFGEAIPPGYLAFPLECYLIVQAATWSRRSITGTEYLLPLAVVVLLAVLTVRADGEFFEAVRLLATVLLPAGFVVVAAAAFGVAYLGVALERRDARIGLPTVQELWEWVRSQERAAPGGFASPMQAQCWFERKRTFALLPLITICLLGLLTMAALVFEGLRSQAFLVAVLALPVVLTLAASIAALIADKTRCRYALFMPQRARALARARLLVALESVVATVPLLVVFGAGMVAVFGQGQVLFFLESWRHGEVSPLEIAGMCLAPLVLGAPFAWSVATRSSRGSWFVAMVGMLGVVSPFVYHALSEDQGVQEGFVLFVVALVACVPLEGLYQAARRRLLTVAAIACILVLWAGLIVAVAWLTPGPAALYWRVIGAAAVTGLLVAPLFGVPVEMAKWRTQ